MKIDIIEKKAHLRTCENNSCLMRREVFLIKINLSVVRYFIITFVSFDMLTGPLWFLLDHPVNSI